MDFIIIVALVLLIIWFLLGPESKFKAWFKQQFKKFYSLLGKKKYQNQHRVRTTKEKPKSQSSSKNISASDVEASNQNTHIQSNPIDPKKVIVYPIIMRDQVVTLIKQNPSWLQVIEVHQLLELIDNKQLSLNEKMEAISHHATKSQLSSQKLGEPYDKVSDKLFSLISQIEIGDLSNLYEVKEQLIDFKSHFKAVSHVFESLINSILIKQLPGEISNPLAEKVEQIIKNAKGDILQTLQQLSELSKSELFQAHKLKKGRSQEGGLVKFIEKLLSVDLASTKAFTSQLAELPTVSHDEAPKFT